MTRSEVLVLIADDKRSARQGLKALLARIPEIEVVGEATSGQEALDLTTACRPDVVLMDIRMCPIDGLEATRRIKSQWPQVRVIILTVYLQYRQQALAAGADAFLLKGGTVESLQNTIFRTRKESNRMKQYPEYYEHLSELMGKLGGEIPGPMGGFSRLHQAAVADGVLSAKVKELIALGIAITVRCDGCIAFHVHDALNAGASHDEIVETIGVAVLMGGGPAVMYGSEALEALAQFEERAALAA
jgi:AhpD family alkylhydroperoxidase